MHLAAVAAAALAVGGAPSGAVRGYGLTFDPPPAWHVRIYKRPGGAPVFQAATVRLAADRGTDTAAGTQRRLRRGDVLIVMFEYRAPRRAITLWNRNFPLIRLPAKVRGLNGPFEGQIAPASSSRNFRTGGRYFQLIVYFGDRRPSRATFARANRALARLKIAPRR